MNSSKGALIEAWSTTARLSSFPPDVLGVVTEERQDGWPMRVVDENGDEHLLGDRCPFRVLDDGIGHRAAGLGAV